MPASSILVMDPSTLIRPPDVIRLSAVGLPTATAEIDHDGATIPGARLDLRIVEDSLVLEAEVHASLAWVHLRWQHAVDPACLLLGDAWERGYGDLCWRHLQPERLLPWYVLVHHAGRTGGFGVATGGGALAAWQVDARGISCWLDCRAGGVPVRPAGRRLQLARIHAVAMQESDSPLAVARAFCRRLCPDPRLPREPIYGGNNWYYAYGDTSHAACVADAERIARWSEGLSVRPWNVLDDGWQRDHRHDYNGGPWDAGNEDFADLADTAAAVRATGCRPGIWYRPLLGGPATPAAWRLAAPRPFGHQQGGVMLDPTVPAVQERLRADMQRLVGWGFDMIKHDFTTYDLLGFWGSGYGGPTYIADGWSFADDSRTSAEVIGELYGLLREAAGDALLIGCNTIGHLGAGLFEIQRTGDDTSGRDWERTRLMGINTLAARMPQHGTFFVHDADCVGLTRAVPWEANAQWLDLLARSGTALFVSAEAEAIGPEQEAALRDAFAIAATGADPAEPLDWLTSSCPERWRCADGDQRYDWTSTTDGCPPPGVHV